MTTAHAAEEVPQVASAPATAVASSPVETASPQAATVPAVVQGVSADRISLQALPGTGNAKTDAVLRVVQRSTTGKAVAATVAVNVIGAMFGGFGAGSFHKDDLKGTRIEAIPNPALGAMTTALRARLDAYFSAHPQALPAETKTMQITAGEWLLVYQKLGDENTPYELRFSTHIAVPSKKISFFKYEASGIALACQPQPIAASLAEWQKDDYAQVKQTAQSYVEQCAAQFEQALPRWFPERVAAIAPAAAPE